MHTKYQIRQMLEQANVSLSGESIAQSLGISRVAVWKHIKALQEEGYSISAVNRKGYVLEKTADIISVDSLRALCKEPMDFAYLPSIASTNTAVKALAHEKNEGYVLLAGEQTGGRGRMGRSFFSPGDSGIYMSMLLKPTCSAEQASLLTALAAVSVCRALENVLNLQLQIKWVNDIFLDGKKVCGILSEAGFNMENAQMDYVVIGIGINVYAPKGDFPSDLQNLAGYLQKDAAYNLRNQLIAGICEHFMQAYRNLNETPFMQEYKTRSMVVGKDIFVHKADGLRRARALDIDGACHLLVEYENKERELLHSGEVSIRL